MPAQKGKKVEKDKEDTNPTLKKGTFIFPNGDRYDGEYFEIEGGGVERSGYGEHTTSTGVCYQGHWANDKMNGQGKLTHPSGSSYDGEFVDNQFHGKGTYRWPNGAAYQGNFVDNRLVGDGNYTDVDQQQWGGTFHNKAAPGLKFMLSL
ncbi:putative MORN repeat-containing protein 2-like [Apostichopus japonicus]|uniref:Putative MORN repeat-containing protein 2-like n=1 Tax=Stichopus japonicus TaxID=307972 RepID=A0A2G8JFF8_STIJA|nr:putative MORN repeat-containing protein 2-like [Apostichopus japonicus]